MGFWGIAIGAWIGGRVGGPLGALIGAVVGGVVTHSEPKEASGAAKGPTTSSGSRSGPSPTPEDQQTVFLAAMAAMLAKMAKSDGHVSKAEIDCANAIFSRLGLSAEQRSFCVAAFREAKDNRTTIYAYASNFANVQRDRRVREIFYSLLWDMAVADGELSPEENDILRRIPLSLGVRQSLYADERRRRVRGGESGEGASSREHSRSRSSRQDGGMTLTEAYATLCISSSASDADVKKAYRTKAKQFHPDELARHGLPPEVMQKATEQMARINEAYAKIKSARGL